MQERVPAAVSCALALTVMILTAPARAQATPALADVEHRLAECAATVGDVQRLACFEALAAERLGRTESPPGTAAAPAPPSVPAGRQAAPAEAPEPAPAASAEERFGEESLPRTREAGKPAVSAIAATIERVTARPHGERVFYLSNGQVWTEIEVGRVRYRPGREVRIERAAFGGYMLSSGSARSTRVERVR